MIPSNKISYDKFVHDFQALLKFVKDMQTKMRKSNKSFDEINTLINENKGRLGQVLDSVLKDSNKPAQTPMLKYWIGDGKLSDEPLPGEQDLFNNILEYLSKYYNVKPSDKLLKSLFSTASANTNDVLAQERFYEISQLFSAFGHTSTDRMSEQRIQKLFKYGEPHLFKADLHKVYEAVIFCANELRDSVTFINNIDKTYDNPYTSKGARNVGTPYWSKTTVKLKNKTVEEHCFDLANKLYNSKVNNKDLYKYANIFATMFGRNSTKGTEGKWNGSTFRITKYKASARVIYGISLVTNSQIARVYGPAMDKLKNKLFFCTLKGTDYLREILPKLAKFDNANSVYRVSSDKKGYDTTLSVELMVIAALIDIYAVGTTSKIIDIIILSLIIDALTPIYYKDKIRGPIKVLYTYGGHKSGFQNTFRWGSMIGMFITVYTQLLIRPDWFYKTYRLYLSKGLPPSMFAGDDWSSIFYSKDDYLKASKIEAEHFGLISNIDKSAFGTWIVQNGVNSKGLVSYPLARALRSYYYPEKDPGRKPPFVLLMTAYSNIELLWESPHLDYFIKEHILKTDKYKGGLEYEGKALTFERFYSIFTKQASDYGENIIFDANDPRYTDILNKSGTIKSDWLYKIWSKIKSLYK